MFNTSAKWFLCVYLACSPHHTHTLAHCKREVRKPIWIFWNVWDLIQLIEWKEEKNKRMKSETICAPKNAIVAITIFCFVLWQGPLFDCCFDFRAVSLFLWPCKSTTALAQIHSMRGNNSDEMENWWSRENVVAVAVFCCYNAKIANIWFVQIENGK